MKTGTFAIFLSISLLLSSCSLFQKTPETKTPTSAKPKTTTPRETTANTNKTTATQLPVERVVMLPEENRMIEEINLLRTDPQGYMQYVKEYMQAIRMNSTLSDNFKNEEIAAARELISEMIRMRPLPALKAHMGLYQAAIKQGDDVKMQGELDHVGTDGSFPWDRITDIAKLQEGNENLVGGGKSVRESVIILLVDSGVSGRGHRLALLDHSWEYVACHQIGTVGKLENCWIQVFGKGGKPAPLYEDMRTGIQPTPPTSMTSKPTPYQNNDNYRTNSGDINSNDLSFMTADEQAMIREINLLRDNPRGYVSYVRKYISDFKEAGWDQATTREEVETADELIKELQRRLPLSTLKPHPQLHEVARKHGHDLKRIGKVQHRGSDGSQPWDRITKGTGLSDGNENLVGGGTSVRESVIMLLIDSGIPNRGHRRTLLDPRWDYVACYKVGNIGGIPENWVQVFGKK